MKVNLNNLSCSCLFHLIKNTYKYIFKWDEYSKYSNDERLKRRCRYCHKQKEHRRRERVIKTNKKQNETPLRYIFSIIVVILIILGAFQLGIIGRMIDSFLIIFWYESIFNLYFSTYCNNFITYSKQIPRTRRSIGAIVLQLALLFIAQLYFHFSHNITSQREPVLSFVYKAYEQTHFPNFGEA